MHFFKIFPNLSGVSEWKYNNKHDKEFIDEVFEGFGCIEPSSEIENVFKFVKYPINDSYSSK